MNTFRLLANPRVWGPVLGVVTVLALIFYAYLAAVASSQENLKDLPIALVNEDRGAGLAGEDVNLGDRVAEKVTDPDSPASDTVDWVRPGTRGAALKGIGNHQYYGAIVIPKDYTQRISDLVSPPTIPIAVVVEDSGAVINGQPMKLGKEVEKRIVAPDSPAPDFVKWARLDGREKARKRRVLRCYRDPRGLHNAYCQHVRPAGWHASFRAVTDTRTGPDRTAYESGGTAFYNSPDRERLRRHGRGDLRGYDRAHAGSSL